MTRDGLPRAYLRIDPNLDQTHPDPSSFIRLLCAAARQPHRGRFKDRALLDRLLGRSKVAQMIERDDVRQLDDGRWYVLGWDEWQEGDLDVASRMRRMRARRVAEGRAVKSGKERTADWRMRTAIFERDGYACRYCGAYEYQRDLLIAEHVIPDGPTTEDNLVTACRPCNVRKGGRTPEEAGMTLHDIGYRSTDPFGDAPRVTRPSPSKRVTVTTDAGDTKEEGSSPGVGGGDVPPNPPHRGGRRANGTNPRAIAAAEREAERDRAHRNRLDATQRRIAELRPSA